MDSMPFLHADRAFTLFFEEDLEFKEVRAILDHLLDERAFDLEIQENVGKYIVKLSGASFTVWVAEINVFIRRGILA